jgi:predicted Zn-dependent protease
VLTIMLIALVPAFAVTGAFVRTDRTFLNAEAARWRAQGDRDLAAHQPDAAVEAYRTALARGGDDAAVRLQLAAALIEAGRATEAESHLRTLWTEAPGDGTVNLTLARLAAESGRLPDAVRYYHAAIDGAWERDPVQARRDARFELVNLLLQHHDAIGARSELIVLADLVKDDSDLTLRVARMLVQAGDARTALTLARRVIMARPRDANALALAGDLLFRNADYVAARNLLQRAARQGPLSSDAEAELRDAEDALAVDPLAPRLGSITRQRRLRSVLMTARARMDACVMAAGAQPGPDLLALQDRLASAEHDAHANRRPDPDTLDDALAVVADIEQLPDTRCGPSSPQDRTLRLIARAHPTT